LIRGPISLLKYLAGLVAIPSGYGPGSSGDQFFDDAFLRQLFLRMRRRQAGQLLAMLAFEAVPDDIDLRLQGLGETLLAPAQVRLAVTTSVRGWNTAP
jgi:hypothetical protein